MVVHANVLRNNRSNGEFRTFCVVLQSTLTGSLFLVSFRLQRQLEEFRLAQQTGHKFRPTARMLSNASLTPPSSLRCAPELRLCQECGHKKQSSREQSVGVVSLPRISDWS